ncbi:TetR/AcrR family transcriptional regulator [Leisingera daeponensis]|uniref:TetR/AcrR family transcriptional regulator n=1 Tax=Leisingera daeponensis TaxID=405746 RepID=UPI001C97819C|nr:TetR/AcrR family transcriptional regulator [Leisingera daeponensis]MBY6057849.1 TetR/AcrR family transcriptional regulator [Leisingera daeponensis]
MIVHCRWKFAAIPGMVPERRRVAGKQKRGGQMASAEETRKKRKVDKDLHREVLLEATASVILKYGVSGTTISRIQEESGLSRGMINLHFQSKDNLIRELAVHMTQEYNDAWRSFTSQAPHSVSTPEDAAARLQALFATDFSEAVLNERSARLTFAFRAEPDLQALGTGYIETRGTDLHDHVRNCCKVLCDACGTQGDPEKVTMAIMSLLEGLWTDFHAHPDEFSREYAVEICRTTARAFFPGYF